MSEERMILTKEQWEIIYGLLGWVPFDKEEREIKYAWFDHLEPAPSKDFKPKCSVMDVTLFSSGVYREDGTCVSASGMVPLCFTCDLRESCIYKRE